MHPETIMVERNRVRFESSLLIVWFLNPATATSENSEKIDAVNKNVSIKILQIAIKISTLACPFAS